MVGPLTDCQYNDAGVCYPCFYSAILFSAECLVVMESLKLVGLGPGSLDLVGRNRPNGGSKAADTNAV